MPGRSPLSIDIVENPDNKDTVIISAQAISSTATVRAIGKIREEF